MLRIVINTVGGCNKPAGEFDLFAGIEVPIKTREIAAGNFEAQQVSMKKNIAGGPKIERNLVGLPGIHQRGMFL